MILIFHCQLHDNDEGGARGGKCELFKTKSYMNCLMIVSIYNEDWIHSHHCSLPLIHMIFSILEAYFLL